MNKFSTNITYMYFYILLLTLCSFCLKSITCSSSSIFSYLSLRKKNVDDNNDIDFNKNSNLLITKTKVTSSSLSSSSLSSSSSENLFSRWGILNKKTSINLLSESKLIENERRRKKKVLILMSDTGGGHRASAEAIELALAELFPHRIEVEIVDIWTAFAPYPFNTFVTTYRFLAKHPTLWRAFYMYGRFPLTKVMTELWSRTTCYNTFKRAIERSNPDLIVSVHPLCQHIPIPIVKKMNKMRKSYQKPISFVTVVTDLGGAHVTWFHKGADKCFVPSPAVKKIALRTGLKPSRITMHGLPIRSSFWKSGKSKDVIRKKLNLEQNVQTVLVMGGGDGVGGLSKIAIQLATKLSHLKNERSQIIIICGWNKQVAAYLNAYEWPKNVNVVVKGFCQNIDAYMSASDCLVTKAGPGTIAEAMTRGLPIIISSYLPGQEEGNVPYVVKGGFGLYSGSKPKRIASIVYKLFQNKNILEEMSVAAESNSNPDATKFIARDIGNLVLSDKETTLNSADKLRMKIQYFANS